MKKLSVVILMMFLFSTQSTFARNKSVKVADVVNLVQAGVSDDTIRQVAATAERPLLLSARDVIVLRQAGTSDELLRDLIADGQQRVKAKRQTTFYRPYYGYGYSYHDPFWPRMGLSYGFSGHAFRYRGGGHFVH